MNVLEVLIRASEKAAFIARSCADTSEDSLLVTEKGENESNTRFDKDLKTIADVLAQESAKAEIASCIPELAANVRGEECNEINNVKICIQESKEMTAELLTRLIPPSAAKRLATAAHTKISNESTDKLPNILLDPSELGVWIDPIDGTAEFIAGVKGEADLEGGLACVTVLIGAYMRTTGEPVIGVINQPFYNGNKGRIVWGVSHGDEKKWFVKDEEINSVDNNVVLVSGAEKPDIISNLKSSGWEVKSVPGAGHKLLKVVLGEASAYVVSKGTTFRWDTCAPHAILNSGGGGLVTFTTKDPITYNAIEGLDAKEYCNSDGIIAYANEDVLTKISNLIK